MGSVEECEIITPESADSAQFGHKTGHVSVKYHKNISQSTHYITSNTEITAVLHIAFVSQVTLITFHGLYS